MTSTELYEAHIDALQATVAELRQELLAARDSNRYGTKLIEEINGWRSRHDEQQATVAELIRERDAALQAGSRMSVTIAKFDFDIVPKLEATLDTLRRERDRIQQSHDYWDAKNQALRRENEMMREALREAIEVIQNCDADVPMPPSLRAALKAQSAPKEPKRPAKGCPYCSFDPTNSNDFCDEHRPAAPTQDEGGK